MLRHDRRRALANIAAAFPDWTPRQRRTTIRTMFHHLGMTLAEVLWLPNLDAETCARTTTFEGLENLRPGEGMIGITGHCGNWEWIAHAIALRTPLTVLHRGRDEPKMNLFITELRAKVGITTIDRGSTAAAPRDDPRAAPRQHPGLPHRSEHPRRKRQGAVLRTPRADADRSGAAGRAHGRADHAHVRRAPQRQACTSASSSRSSSQETTIPSR